ncbi:MAG: signal peptidase I [Clostridia bacterium]|nr:signal peptidase I [Clostridia bacterium]
MKKKQKNLIGENERTVLQPVLFSDDGEKSRGILIPETDTLDELASYKNLRKKRIKRAISRAVLWTLLVGLLPIFVFFSVIIFSPNTGNSFFGYTLYLVKTNSMVPEFCPGDMIMVKTNFSIDDIKPGTDITFVRLSDGEIVTHRVKSYVDTENGREYTTYGINVPQGDDDDPVNFNNILGVRIKTLTTLGSIVTFFRSTVGLIVFFAIFAVLIGGIYVSFVFSNDIRAVGK